MSVIDEPGAGPASPGILPRAGVGEREPYDVRLEEDRWATVRHLVEALAIVCAGVWAFYTFVYQEKIKPAGEPAALAITLSMTSLGHDRSRDVINLQTRLANTGKTEIDIAADGFNVWGERYGTRAAVRRIERSNWYEYHADLPIIERRLITAFVELRGTAVGGRRGTHIIIEPGASETLANVFAVPPGAYDIIHAQAMVIPLKTSQTGLVPVVVHHNRVGGYWIFPGKGSDADEDDNNADFVPPR